MQIHQSFINYKNYRYGVYATLLSVSALIAYVLDSPRQPPNGGTWLGYALGTIAALIIIMLMLFGLRKRAYQSSLGTVAGWLSSHVYFGLALWVIATLHCGFQFGWNVHTLAYLLMCLVIISGIWGAYTYLQYPTLLLKQRRDLSRDELFEKVKELDRRAIRLAVNLDRASRNLLLDAIRRTALGGKAWAQLSGYDNSKILFTKNDQVQKSAILIDNRGQNALIEILAGKLAQSDDDNEIACLQDLLEITGNKTALLKKLNKDIQVQGLLQFWLYLHLPLSFALLAALTIHILSVFLYW